MDRKFSNNPFLRRIHGKYPSFYCNRHSIINLMRFRRGKLKFNIKSKMFVVVNNYDYICAV
jgi:hypothetical protein